jgi:hypothetical protein
MPSSFLQGIVEKLEEQRVVQRVKEMRKLGVSEDLIDAVSKEARDFKNFAPIVWLYKEAYAGRLIDPSAVTKIIDSSRAEVKKPSFLKRVTRGAEDLTIAVQVDELLALGADREVVNSLAKDARENRNLEPLERLFKEMNSQFSNEAKPRNTRPF